MLAPLSGHVSHKYVLSTQWDKITLSALAPQMGGVTRDGFPNPGDIALQATLANLSETDLMDHPDYRPPTPPTRFSILPASRILQRESPVRQLPISKA